MSTRTPETLITRLLDDDYSEIIKIDDTLQRSSKVIQDSINLAYITQKRKIRSRSKLDKSFEYIPREQDIVPRSSPQILHSNHMQDQSLIYEKNKDMPYSSTSFSEENLSWKSQNDHQYYSPYQKEILPLKGDEEYELKISELMKVLKRETDLKLKSDEELRYVNLKNKEMKENEINLRKHIETLTDLLNKTKIDENYREEKVNNVQLESSKCGTDGGVSEIEGALENQKVCKMVNPESQIKELKESHRLEIMQLKDQILELSREKTLFELRYNNLFSIHSQSTDYEIIQTSIEQASKNNDKETSEIEEHKKLEGQNQAVIERLEKHIENLEKQLNYQLKVNKKLEKELSSFYEKASISSYDINIDILRSASKISDLEEKVKKMTAKYEKLRSTVINNENRSASVNSFHNHIAQESRILKSDLSRPDIRPERNKSCMKCQKRPGLFKSKSKKPIKAK